MKRNGFGKKVFLVGSLPPPAGSMLGGDIYIQVETEIALNPEASKKTLNPSEAHLAS